MHFFDLRKGLAAKARGAISALIALSTIAGAQGTIPRLDNAYVWALDVTAPNGRHNVLMGTLHVPDRDLRQPAPSILKSYRVVVTEHATVNQGIRPTVHWHEALTKDDVATLRQQLQCMAPSASAFAIDDMLTAVLAEPTPLEANQLAYQRCSSTGYASRDQIIEAATVHYGLARAYLETPEEAGDAPLALSRRLGGAESGRSVHFALSAEAKTAQADYVEAMNAGDYDAASAAERRTLEGAGINVSAFEEIMVGSRNIEWMKSLPLLLDQGDAFILVGSGHLSGQSGLIAMLQERGYSVRPVKVAAGTGMLNDANGQYP